MNDSRRSVQHGNGTYAGVDPVKCDYTGSSSTNSDWVGAGWYRMMAPAGTRIPESTPGSYQCSTLKTGWLRGSHPTIAGQTTQVLYCFDGKGYGSGYTDCSWSVKGKVTHCKDYFVYYLENTPTCTLRYCATDHF